MKHGSMAWKRVAAGVATIAAVIALIAALACDERRPTGSPSASASPTLSGAPVATPLPPATAVPQPLPAASARTLGAYRHHRLLILFGPDDTERFRRMQGELARARFELQDRGMTVMDMSGTGERMLGHLDEEFRENLRRLYAPFPSTTTVVATDREGALVRKWRGAVSIEEILHAIDSLPSRHEEVAARDAQRRAPPPPSQGARTCADAKTAACLGALVKEEYSAAALRDLYPRVRACFSDDASLRAERASCLPFTVGRDARTGKDLELVYFCSDVCPAQGGVFLRYAGVSQQTCCDIGGGVISDPAWGGYRGCGTPEDPGHQYRIPKRHRTRLDDGSWFWSVYDPCRGGGRFDGPADPPPTKPR